MTEPEIIARIQALFEEIFDLSAPVPQANILHTGLLDSLALVTFLLEIEVHFNLEIPLESLEIPDISTIGGIARLVALRNESASSSAQGIR
jgi:acyl carrier protein